MEDDHGMDVEILFNGHPAEAIAFLQPLLVLGIVLSTSLLALAGGAYVTHCCGAAAMSQHSQWWIAVQVAISIIQFPVRLSLLRSLRRAARVPAGEQQGAELVQLSRSRQWSVNKQLGACHGCWFAVGLLVYTLETPTSPECSFRRLLALHLGLFVTRCAFTFGWFALIFGHVMHQQGGLLSSLRATRAKELVHKLPCRRYPRVAAPSSDDADAIADAGGAADERTRVPSTTAPLHESDTCIICLMEFTDGEMLRELGCGHAFHHDCLQQWLGRRMVCPLCQQWRPTPGITPPASDDRGDT